MKSILLLFASMLTGAMIAVSTLLFTLHNIEYWTACVEVRKGVVDAYFVMNIGPFTWKQPMIVNMRQLYECEHARGKSKD